MSKLINTDLPYISWTPQNEDVCYIGVLTQESDDYITLLTKSGEMTIPVTDGTFKQSTREHFEKTTSHFTAEQNTTEVTTKVARVGSKMETCVAIYIDMKTNNADVKRIDVIKAFMAALNISQSHASTYYQTIKAKQ